MDQLYIVQVLVVGKAPGGKGAVEDGRGFIEDIAQLRLAERIECAFCAFP
ncbi:hypothetical protein [Microbulbifer discodermiae]